jgi:hypothetical protein
LYEYCVAFNGKAWSCILFYVVGFPFSVDLKLMRFVLCWNIGICLNVSLRPASAALRFHSCCIDFLQPSTGISRTQLFWPLVSDFWVGSVVWSLFPACEFLPCCFHLRLAAPDSQIPPCRLIFLFLQLPSCSPRRLARPCSPCSGQFQL